MKAGERIELDFFRCTDQKAVWYEWQLIEPRMLPMQNVGGAAFRVPLT